MMQLKKYINMDRLSTKGQMIDQIDLRAVPHSGFDRSNHNYLTGRLGNLIPKRLDEVYPGDRIKGTPECVTNFEPLAAPLMGTMVQKQEQFFVPYIQLWRHAWKFFTGKNGFDENMPSITPAHLFDVHANVWLQHFMNAFLVELVQDLDYLYYQSFDSGLNSRVFLYQDFKNVVDVLYSSLETNFGNRKMVDLLEPIINNVRRFYKDAYIKDTSIFQGGLPTTDFESRFKGLNEFDYYTLRFYAPTVYFSDANAFHVFIIDFLRDIVAPFISRAYMYVFGPSSLCDYLGWPIDTKVPHFYFGNPETGVVDSESDDDFAAYFLLQNLFHQSIDAIDVLTNISQFHLSHIPLNFMPFKAYYVVWYWNYRDQLLETGILDPEEDEFLGSTITDNVILYCTIIRQRCWFKDTFTTALTNTGDGNLIVPAWNCLEGDYSADITYYDANNVLINTTDHNEALNAGATLCAYKVGNITYKVPTNYLSSIQNQSGTSSLFNLSYISLDVFDRIKRLRSVVQKRLILGYEVDDVIFSSFMVRMSNVRMHIPEILGRGRDTVQMSTLVNNTSTDKQIAGDKTATAWCHSKSSELNYFSEDWGIYIDITTVMPIQSYAGGMQRLFLKREPFDFMWPEFATMGMDAIYNSELAAVGTRLKDATALQVFGYQGRYYDLKSRQDEEHGRLLTDLNYLTFSREWNEDNPPKLNYQFVHCWPRLDGFVMEDPMEDVFRMDAYTGQGWERRLPVPSEIVGR